MTGSIVPETVSAPQGGFSLISRINFLKTLHARNGERIVAWQAMFLSNVMDMKDDERVQVPVDQIRAQLDKIKAEFNAMNKILNNLSVTVTIK